MSKTAIVAGWWLAPHRPSTTGCRKFICLKSTTLLTRSFVDCNLLGFRGEVGTQTTAPVPRAFVDKFPDLSFTADSSTSESSNPESSSGKRVVKGITRSWRSRTGRNVTKKKRYGDRMTSILETLKSDDDVERALGSLNVKLELREQSVILNEEKEWSRALAVFAWLKKQASYSPNVIHYNIIIKILGRAQQWTLVEEIWAEMENEKIAPTNVTYSTLIDVYGKAGRIEKALQWCEDMKARGFKPDNVTMNTVINFHKRQGNIARVEELFKTKPEEGDVETYNTMIDMYGRAGLFAEASTIFSDMMKAGVAPDTVTFNTMIKVCGLAGRIPEAEAMYSRMEDRRIAPDVATFNILIAIFVNAGKLEIALEYFARMKSERGILPDRVTYHTLLSFLASRDMVKEAESIVREMEGSGLAPMESVSVGLVRMYVRTGFLEKASQTLRKAAAKGFLNSSSYAAIIDTYGEQNRATEAEEIFLGCRLKWTVEVCNTMMKAYGLAGLHEKAYQVFSTLLPENGLVPDETTFNTVLHSLVALVSPEFSVEKVEDVVASMGGMDCKLQRSTSISLIGFYAKLGMVTEAEQTFEQMKADGVELDRKCYGALLNAYAEAELIKEAEQTAAEMKEAGFPVDEVVLTTFMKLYGRTNQLEEVENIYAKMQRPDHFATNLLIELYGREGRIKEAEKIYRKLEEENGVNEITLTTMLESYKSAGLVKQALGMATKMLKMLSLEDIISYNSILGLYASLGRITEAMEAFKLLDARRIEPDMITYTIMAGVLKRIGSVREAIDLFATASSSGLVQTLQSLTTLVSLYARAGLVEESFEVCNKLRDWKFDLDTEAYNALIFAFGTAGRFDESLRLFMEMQAKGLEPDVVTYTTVITVYGRAGLLEGVTRIFKRMKQSGCEPSMATYKSVIDIYRNAGKLELSAMVYQEMKFAEYLRQQDQNMLDPVEV